MNKLQIAFFVFIGFLYSCGESFYYSHEEEMEHAIWTYDHPFSSQFESRDSTQLYQIWLDVTHDANFDYQNLYIRIQTIFPSQDTVYDVLPLELKGPDGAWAGECSSDQCTTRFNLISRTAFRHIGKHFIQIEQYGRMDSLQGIYALGLHIVKL